MPVPLPDLDTRTWADLVEEARALIPRYAPGWTDHNLHDPGLTLVELLAWLVEMDIYQLNRVPATHRRKFLALAGIQARPPAAAGALLGLAPQRAVTIRRGLEFQSAVGDGAPLLFRASAPRRAVAARLSALAVEPASGAARTNRLGLLAEGLTVPPFGDDPQPGAALWLGFDRPLSPDRPVHLAFLFAGPRCGPAERERILAEAGLAPDASLPPHHSVRLAWEYYAPGGWRPLDPAAGQVVDDTRALTLDGMIRFRLPGPSAPLSSASRAEEYYLRARLVEGVYDSAPRLRRVIVNAVPVQQATPVTMSFSIAAGAPAPRRGPARPRRVRLRLRLDPTGAVTALAFTADRRVPAVPLLWYQPPTEQAPGGLILDLALLGTSDGLPGQEFILPRGLVAEGALALYTLEPRRRGGAPVWRAWQVRTDLDATRSTDAHYLLDPSGARVRFGDGDRGRIPPVGTPILVRYQATGAAAGNLAPDQITTLAPTLRNWMLCDPRSFQATVATQGWGAIQAGDPGRAWEQLAPTGYAAWARRFGAISQVEPAAGGAPAETLDAATVRAVTALLAPARAVTGADYEALALATPGTAIARVKALPGRHPACPSLAAPGVVTVIVIPDQAQPQPTPSRGLLAAVRRYLDRRRTLGTRVEVVGPRYLVVAVRARVRTLPGAPRDRVRAAVQAALDAFLHPVTGGPAAIAPPHTAGGTELNSAFRSAGPKGHPASHSTIGWPFGRDVFRAEILQVIDGVAGVDHVLSLELAAPGTAAQCGNLCVGPLELVAPGRHVIEVEP